MSINQTTTAERSILMQERAATLIDMTRFGLSLEWIHQFSLKQLRDCCIRMSESLEEDKSGFRKPIERELIQNPLFASYLAELLQMCLKGINTEQANAPDAGSSYNHSPNAPKPSAAVALRHQLETQLSELLDACQKYDGHITDFAPRDVIETLELKRMNGREAYIYLKNFASLHLPEDDRKQLEGNLHCCPDVPVDLSEEQKAFLREPFMTTRDIFTSNPFPDTFDFFHEHPALLDIVRLLHQKNIVEDLDLNHYKGFAANAEEHIRLFTLLANQMDPEPMGSLLSYWTYNDCPLQELQRMVRRIEQDPDQNWYELLCNYSGYVNLLYGLRFKTIDLKDAASYQEQILTYAIVNRKKQFIRLVDEHAELFLRLTWDSVLFMEELYQNHFNLNELTEKDLHDLVWMKRQGISTSELTAGRRYSFPELKALYDVPAAYVTFYNLLSSTEQDHRLLVLRQLRKRKALHDETCDELAALAQRLDSKTLYDWLQKDFGHIAGLDAGTAVQMLIHLDALRHLIPSFQSKSDVILALRNLATLEQFPTVEELKSNIIQVDEDWRSLSDVMELSDSFIQQYRERIMTFLSQNGAYIANTYLQELKENQKSAFSRVIKAELMGQFHKLKYFEGDLQRELDYPINSSVLEKWKQNMRKETPNITIQEYDDFFSTMLVGNQPQRTCLSYESGGYRACLLSGFDSNKKILYASLDDRIVGRAFLRLTKGRLNHDNKQSSPGFTFVDVSTLSELQQDSTLSQEQLTLFLECPYIAGVKPEIQTAILQAFIDLAKDKADEMGVMLVLSEDYGDADTTGFAWTTFHIYISKSKAGAQYLDSLGGEASVSSEGRYRVNQFYIRRRFGTNDFGEPLSTL